MKFLIVGTLTNPSKRLKTDLKSILGAIGEGFEAEVHLIESDSKKSSLKYLHEVSLETKNFSFRSLGYLKSGIPERVERIRYSRNHYVNFIRENYPERLWDWIIVADLDGMNSKLSASGLISSIDLLQTYDAVFANQKFGYYDLYALREKKWMPKDPIVQFYEKVLEINENNTVKTKIRCERPKF